MLKNDKFISIQKESNKKDPANLRPITFYLFSANFFKSPFSIGSTIFVVNLMRSIKISLDLDQNVTLLMIYFP